MADLSFSKILSSDMHSVKNENQGLRSSEQVIQGCRVESQVAVVQPPQFSFVPKAASNQG